MTYVGGGSYTHKFMLNKDDYKAQGKAIAATVLLDGGAKSGK